MKALEITAPGKYEIREVPIPEPGPREVLVKVLAVTTCPHWDLHILGGQPMLPAWPLNYPYTLGQPGHEACGDVAAIGKDVTEVNVGDRVCMWRDQGHHRSGCYAQYVIADAESVIHVPENIPPESCASLELAMCASSHVLLAEKLDAISGKSVGVFGLGPAGLVFVQLAKAAGAERVVGFDPMQERRDLAARLGADAVFDPNSQEGLDFPRRFCPGSLYTSFDCVGVPPVVHRALELTDCAVILFAVQRETYQFTPDCWVGMILAGTQPHTRTSAEYAANRLREGSLDLGSLVTHKMRLEDYGRGVELLRNRQAIKVAFMPQE